jgi:hypothetical protein
MNGLEDDRPQDPEHHDEDGAAVVFHELVVPDHQDAIVVAPLDGHQLEENPALHLGE